MNHIFARVSDAAFSDNLVTKKTTKGYLFTLFRRPIDWRLTKQRSITKSSIETKLLALSYAAIKSI